MKTINYTGRSKLISRIVHLLNRKAPLPLDGDGDAEWGTSGQVLTTDGQGNTYWGEGGGGGGGDVTDVEVNGTSVVNAQGVAEVSVPTKTSDLTNDSGFITSADVPTKTSDLTNDSGFITNLVNNLANYYTKSQTYTQAEVDALISGIVTLNILVVQTLPTQDISTTTIYLVPKQDTGASDIYDEYLYINNAWELIGTTQIDLSNYVTTTDLSTALADYVTSVGLATILAGYVQSSDLAAVATSGSYNDLSNKPSIPTVGDGTITIQKNGSTVDTFTTNQSTNKTVNITVTEGHTIWNRIKTALTARAALWFADASVSDASTDGATKVEVVTELASETAFDNLATDGTADGAYVFPDSGGTYLDASMVAYSGGTVADGLDDTVSRTNGGTFEGDLYLNTGGSRSRLYVGASDGSSQGQVVFYRDNSYASYLYTEQLSEDRAIGLPNRNGTLASRDYLFNYLINAYNASKSYCVGEIVEYYEEIYRCTTACQPASWAVNSVCFEQVNIMDILNVVGKIETFSVTAVNVTISSQRCRRINNITTLAITCTFTAISAGSAVYVCDLPSGYYPHSTASTIVTNGYNTVLAYVTSAGEMFIRILSGSGVSSASFTITY